LLTGSTVDEIESSAAALAEFVDVHAARRQEQEPPDLVATARAAKEERKRTLLAALAGRREQPRDPRGRYASFDGGARPSVPAARNAEAEHAELAARLIGESRQSRGSADVGRHF
jgi:hypothetical protein